MDCLHTNQRFISRDKGWACKACGEIMSSRPKWKPEDGVPLTSMGHDVNNIAEKNLKNNPTLSGAGLTKGAQQERAYSEMVADARSNYVPRKDVKAHYKVPPEVYFARQKEDKKYWDDPKNVERYTDMKIS